MTTLTHLLIQCGTTWADAEAQADYGLNAHPQIVEACLRQGQISLADAKGYAASVVRLRGLL